MESSENAKRDMVVVYGGRTFALRAYRDDAIADGPRWRSLIIENHTPLRFEPRLTDDPAASFADAVRQLTANIEARAEAERAQPAGSGERRPGA